MIPFRFIPFHKIDPTVKIAAVDDADLEIFEEFSILNAAKSKKKRSQTVFLKLNVHLSALNNILSHYLWICSQ